MRGTLALEPLAPSLAFSITSRRVTELPSMRSSGMEGKHNHRTHAQPGYENVQSGERPVREANERQGLECKSTNGHAQARGIPTMAQTFVACPKGVMEVRRLDSNVPIAMPPMK